MKHAHASPGRLTSRRSLKAGSHHGRTLKTALWPNFFVAGAAKSGTSSLYKILRQHPQVFMSYPKEPHFFTQVTPPEELRWHFEIITDPRRYLRLFAGADGFRAVGEASTSYLWHREVPRRIRHQVPDARIVIMLRDPVARAYSHYLMHVREGIQTLPFLDALKQDISRTAPKWGISHYYTEKGRYAAQVRRYLEVFGEERVKVVMFDRFRRDPSGVAAEIVRYLDLDPGPVRAIDTSKVHNPYRLSRGRWAQRLAGSTMARILGETVVPRPLGAFIYEHFLLKSTPKPAMDPRARDFLLRIYEPDVRELEVVLGRETPELRRSWSRPMALPGAVSRHAARTSRVGG